MKKMLAIMLHLSRNVSRSEWEKSPFPLAFNDTVWERMLPLAADCGFNTVLLDVGNAIHYRSHPEISVPDAWSAQRIQDEVARCRALGLTLMPLLNFSAKHDHWLDAYGDQVCTLTYRQVAGDLIRELYELFDHPAYIHIGMDEENEVYLKQDPRPGRLYWEDFRSLIDSVKSTGAKPWIWADPLFEKPLMYATNIAPEECILSPWYYHAYKPEHFTPTDSAPEYVEYYGREQFAKLNLRYVEEDPLHSTTRCLALPLMQKGYCYIPCASVYNHCIYNTEELVEHFLTGAPENQLLGFMTAPWCLTLEENWKNIEDSILLMHRAVQKYGLL